MPTLLCYWGFNKSLAWNRWIVWGNDPSAAQHPPFLQEDPVLCTEQADEPQISLCAKISEHIKNIPVPCTPLLELLSCVCVSGPCAAFPHTDFCISDPRVRVGILLCGRKWGTHSHITPPLHGDHALQGAIRELYHIYLASVVRCHH